ncbi:MAG TPA: LPS export ABC transporter periplasmic protein LptC, partial [Gammaproteobacteria bacterium]
GVISEGGKSVMLQGDVFIEQVRAHSDRNLKILTSDLNIRTEEKFVNTEKPITIVDNFGVTEAVGMRADLKEHRLQLMSQVRGNYQPLYD